MTRRFCVVMVVVAMGFATVGIGVAGAAPASGTVSCTATAKGSFTPALTNTPQTVSFSLKLKATGCTHAGNAVTQAKVQVNAVTLAAASCLNSLGTTPIKSRAQWSPTSYDDSRIDFITRNVGVGFSSLRLGGPVYDADARISTWPSGTEGGSFGLSSAAITLGSIRVKGKGAVGCATGIRSFTGTGTFAVPIGEPPGTAGLEGTVTVAGGPVVGAPVQACRVDGTCTTGTTNGSGFYSLSGLVGGTYGVTAFAPAGSSLRSATVDDVVLTDHATAQADLEMSAPPGAPPPGTTITARGTYADGVPMVFWEDPLEVETNGCASGTASFQLNVDGTDVRSETMTETPAGSGHYIGTTAPLSPLHGDAHVHISITCPDTSVQNRDFDIYIDPSGVIVNQASNPVTGATVTLYRSDKRSGPFTVVPDGSAVMSPSNRQNPMLSGSDGAFGWDVIAGYYRVRAQKSGCIAPGGAAFAETAVMTIPPPVLDIVLRLECGTPRALCPTLRVTTASLPAATVDHPYAAQLAACGSSLGLKWKKVGKLPKGLKLSKTGVIKGAATRTGTFSFQVQVRDSAKKQARQTATRSFTIQVH